MFQHVFFHLFSIGLANYDSYDALKVVLFLIQAFDALGNAVAVLLLSGSHRMAKVDRSQGSQRSWKVEKFEHSRNQQTSHEDVNWTRKVEELSMRGMTLRSLLQFYQENLPSMPDWKYAPREHKTRDVVRRAIIPLTSREECAFSVSAFNKDGPKRAQVMVTHNWGNSFSDLLAAVLSDALQECSFSLPAELLQEDCAFLQDLLAKMGRLDETYWICAFAVNQHISICHSNPYDRDPFTDQLHPVCQCNSTNIIDSDGRSASSEINKFDDMMRLLATTGGCRQVIAVDKPLELFQPIARAGCDIRPAVSKWSKAVGGTVASGKIAEATPPKDAMEVEVTHSSNGEEMDTSGQATKRQTETKGASPEKKRAKAVCTNFDTPFGFQRVDCGGNGDCGYRAAAAAYALADGRDLKETKENAPTLGATLRAQVASHLKKHQLWKDSWAPDDRWTESTEGGTVPTTYDEWLESTARPGRWVCGPTLIGIATRLKRNLVVFRFADDKWEKADLITPLESNAKDVSTAASFPPLPLFLKDNHYFTLEPREEGWPATWSSPADKKWDPNLHRGGGKSLRSWLPSSSASVASTQSASRTVTQSQRKQKSLKSWLPASSSAKSRSPAIGINLKSWLPQSSCSTLAKSCFPATREASPAPSLAFSDDASLRKEDISNKNVDCHDTDAAKVASSWTCPECGYCTENRVDWVKRRRQHIVTWHPDKKDDWNLRNKPLLVPWTPDCTWKCPLCNMGMPPNITDCDTSYRLRKEHAQQQHPTAKRSRFFLPTPNNSAKATLAKISAGVAQRLLDLKAGKQGDHDVIFLKFPPFKEKVKRLTVIHPFCKKCSATAVSIAQIAKIPCNVSRRGGPGRQLLIRRVRAAVNDVTLPDALKKDLQHTLSWIDAPSGPAVDHQIDKFPWPLPSPASLYICKVCRQVNIRRASMTNTKCCGEPKQSPRHVQLLRQLDTAHKTARGHRRDQIVIAQNILLGKANVPTKQNNND